MYTTSMMAKIQKSPRILLGLSLYTGRVLRVRMMVERMMQQTEKTAMILAPVEVCGFSNKSHTLR